MSIRRMKYNKNGFDIICRVHGSGEYSWADILWKSYGENQYQYIGRIYKVSTMACGTTRDTATWHHVKGESPMHKKSWQDAAKDLFKSFKKEAA